MFFDVAYPMLMYISAARWFGSRNNETSGTVGPVAYVNILPWLSRTTLDIIGLAGEI